MSRVFVSSTCHDLIDSRAEIEQHLRALGCTPVMSDRPTSEFEVSGTTDSIKTCLVNLRKADVVVCILSQRYGPAIPGYDGRSATHVEWEEALGLAVKEKLRLLTYVRDRAWADHDTWRANRNSLPKHFPWLGEASKAEPILRFIDAIRKLETERPNWVWTFQNSLDLKDRLALDLQAESRAARLTKLLLDGTVPVMVLEALARDSAGRIQLTITNYRPEPALSVQVSARPESEAPDGLWQSSEAPIVIGDKIVVAQIRVPVSEMHVGVNVKVAYETRFGDQVEERWLLSVPGPTQPSLWLTAKAIVGRASWTK